MPNFLRRGAWRRRTCRARDRERRCLTCVRNRWCWMLERVAPASSARRAAWKARMRNVLLSASGSCSVGMVNLRIKGAFDFFALELGFSSFCFLICVVAFPMELRVLLLMTLLILPLPCVLQEPCLRQTDITAWYSSFCSSNLLRSSYSMRFAVRKLSRPNVLTPAIPSVRTNSGIVKLGEEYE